MPRTWWRSVPGSPALPHEASSKYPMICSSDYRFFTPNLYQDQTLNRSATQFTVTSAPCTSMRLDSNCASPTAIRWHSEKAPVSTRWNTAVDAHP
jgi:hypothetical protein